MIQEGVNDAIHKPQIIIGEVFYYLLQLANFYSWSSISIVLKVVWILNIWDMYHKQHIISAKSNGTEVHYSRVECQVARVKYRSYFSFSSDQPNNYVISLGNLASGLGWRYFISILSTFKTKL